VWLSPSPGKKKYPLRKFNGNSLKSIVKLQLLQAGIKHDNIEISNVDTTDNKGDYYSHSEFLKKNRKEDGRYLIFAMLK
jgi:copper oxidase (laccase) domain-containing protein